MTQWGLDALFNPGKKHMDEEKRRLQATRAEVGDSSGGKRIDFDSGKVTIRRKSEGPADDDESPGDAEIDADASGSDADDPEGADDPESAADESAVDVDVPEIDHADGGDAAAASPE